MNLESEFHKIIDTETADFVNHICELAGIKNAEQMETISVTVRTAFRLAMYRAALVAIEQSYKQYMQFQSDNE